jgi:hypothetical protein
MVMDVQAVTLLVANSEIVDPAPDTYPPCYGVPRRV